MSYLFLSPAPHQVRRSFTVLSSFDGPGWPVLYAFNVRGPFSTEITGYAVVCIAMHMRKINQVRFWRVFGWFVACFTGFLPETP